MHDPNWLGGDVALSVQLDQDRILWLFGDSFIATTKARSRLQSEMVRNSIGIQSGVDLQRAQMSFHWGINSEGGPASFFEGEDQEWYWPGSAIRLNDGPLVVFLYRVINTPDVGLGFTTTGFSVVIINNPEEPVESWQMNVFKGPAMPFDVIPATAVIQMNDHLVAVTIRQSGTHAGTLIRFPIQSLLEGSFNAVQWWYGDDIGWVSDVGPEMGLPRFVLDDAGSECSIHWDGDLQSFVHVASYGFGQSTIGVRYAKAITGPWSPPITVFHPPESKRKNPFVYAAKAHPELKNETKQGLVITYVANSFDFFDLLTDHGTENLYWPRFVQLSLPD